MSAWPQPAASPRAIDPHVLATRVREFLAIGEDQVVLAAACRLARARVLTRRITIAGRRRLAMLVPVDDGFAILLDPQLRAEAAGEDYIRRRTRFALSHELGHTFFYERAPDGRPHRTVPPDAVEESFCHSFATALLIPVAAARATPVEPAGLFALANRYDTLLSTAAWAIARRHPEISILWLRYGGHPRTNDRYTMRVQWSAGGRFFPRGESLKSPLADLAPGEYAVCREPLNIGGRREVVDLRAWRLRRSMLAVLRHAPRDETGPAFAPRQLSLWQ